MSINKLSQTSCPSISNLTLPTHDDITISFSKEEAFFHRPILQPALENLNQSSKTRAKIQLTYECNSNTSQQSTANRKNEGDSQSLQKQTLKAVKYEWNNIGNQLTNNRSIKSEQYCCQGDYQDSYEAKRQKSEQNSAHSDDLNDSNLQFQQGNEQSTPNQDRIRKKMKQIDNKIRKLQIERNRLKYFLRIDKDAPDSAGSQGLQTKQCPCCGKFISKLCFRCEHLYCKVENCPRKKKQKLNARMLQKMKENKQRKGRPSRAGLSKQQRLQNKRQSKEGEQEDQSENELWDTSSELDISNLSNQEQWSQMRLRHTAVQHSKKPSKMTLSESLKDSEIFFDE